MIIVNPVRDHLKHKKILLKKISEFIHDNDTHIAVEEANLSGNKDDIYSPIQSDFFSSLKEQSEYLKYFYSDVITPTILTIGHGLKLSRLTIKYITHGFNNTLNQPNTLGTTTLTVSSQIYTT